MLRPHPPSQTPQDNVEDQSIDRSEDDIFEPPSPMMEIVLTDSSKSSNNEFDAISLGSLSSDDDQKEKKKSNRKIK